MTAPVSTTTIARLTALSDELLVNRDGDTALQRTSDLALQLASSWPLEISGNAGKLFSTYVELAATAYGDFTPWVFADPDVSKNGMYRWNGSGWEWSLPLPYGFLIASNVGAGTPAAIKATTLSPVSTAALILLPIAVDYAGTAATVSFNGGAMLAIKTNRGDNIMRLDGGSVVYGTISGATFRLASDEAIASLIYTARDEAVAAEIGAQLAETGAAAARDIAEGFASDIVSSSEVPIISTAVGLAGLTIKDGIIAIQTRGYYAANGEGAAQYRLKAAPEAVQPGDKISNGGAKRWGLAELIINPRMLGARGDYFVSGADDYGALQGAIDLGRAVEITDGDYGTSHPLIIRKTGQIITFRGSGFGYGVDPLLNYKSTTRVVAFGTAARRVMTRRLLRMSAADPNDAPMSAVIDVEADGVQLVDACVWLDCDYSDVDPANLGAEWDVGIFVGCRPGVQLIRPQVIGPFRKVGIYLDVTRSTISGTDVGSPELPDYDGIALPDHPSFSGIDGCKILHPYVRGARVGWAILGAKEHSGSGQYYDWVSGGMLPDNRGSSGASDVLIFDPRIYAGGHQSGRRFADPAQPLSYANMALESDFAPAACYVDGWAANSSSTTHGLGALRGIIIVGGRHVSTEMFRMRFGLCDGIYCMDRQWIEAGVSSWADKNGNPINVNDYTNLTYGHIATDQTRTGVVFAFGVTGGALQRWVPEGKLVSMAENGYSLTRSMRVSADAELVLGANDPALFMVYDQGTGSRGGAFISGTRPFITLRDISGGAISFQEKVDANQWQLRSGAYSAPGDLADLLLSYSANSGKFSFQKPVTMPSYTVGTLPSAATVGSGTLVYCSNGRAGAACIAMALSSTWYVVGSYSPVSIS